MSNAAPSVIMRPTTHSARVRDEGDQVVLILDGRPTEMTPEAAIQIARALIAKARVVQERQPANAMRTIKDEALLLRAGIPLSISANPKIRAEAEKEAATDRDLRRYLPGGIKSEEHVSAPVVSHVKKGTGP